MIRTALVKPDADKIQQKINGMFGWAPEMNQLLNHIIPVTQHTGALSEWYFASESIGGWVLHKDCLLFNELTEEL